MTDAVGLAPSDAAFYAVSWTRWLANRDFTAADIERVVWTVPAPLVKQAEQLVQDQAYVWITGAVLGQAYTLICQIVMRPNALGVQVKWTKKVPIIGKV